MKLKRFVTLFLALSTTSLAPMALCGNTVVQTEDSVPETKLYETVDFDLLVSSDYSSLSNEQAIAKIRGPVTEVLTPNGTPVEVTQSTIDFSDTEKAENDAYINSLYPNATLISPSTLIYNCHSYAWYQQSTDNPYWMNDPTAYYTDGSYSESIGYIGDIVCYYESSGKLSHSGVIIEHLSNTTGNTPINIGSIMVRSKWGSCGLYEHLGDYCPYMEEGASVKYYHRHNYTTLNPINTSNHTLTCVCGESITEPHSYTARYVGLNASFHDAYCACGASIKTTHTWLPSNTRYRFCQYCNYRKDTWSDIGVLVTDPDRPLLTFLHNY